MWAGPRGEIASWAAPTDARLSKRSRRTAGVTEAAGTLGGGYAGYKYVGVLGALTGALLGSAAASEVYKMTPGYRRALRSAQKINDTIRVRRLPLPQNH